jgi:hypothetical protein
MPGLVLQKQVFFTWYNLGLVFCYKHLKEVASAKRSPLSQPIIREKCMKTTKFVKTLILFHLHLVSSQIGPQINKI